MKTINTIKLRAWDSDENAWIHPSTVAIDGLGHVLEYRDGWKAGNVDRVQVSIFTGLKDKNGVEIYDGDIVKARTYQPAAVEWDNDGVWKCGNFYLMAYKDDTEVLGNVYEHPALLDNGKNE